MSLTILQGRMMAKKKTEIMARITMAGAVILLDILIDSHLGAPMVTLEMKITLDMTSMLMKIDTVRGYLLARDLSPGVIIQEKGVIVGPKIIHALQTNILVTSMIGQNIGVQIIGARKRIEKPSQSI